MDTQQFKIVYTDENGIIREHIDFYTDSHDPCFISAQEWAQDVAYSLADKGYYRMFVAIISAKYPTDVVWQETQIDD